MPSVSLTVARGEKLPISRGAGLTAKGRARYNRATGANLKAPQPGGGRRKDSFCARMTGVVRHSKGDAPRARAALRRWRCPGWEENPRKKAGVAPGQGGVPYYKKLGGEDALDPSRKRMRSVPYNYKLAYISGWYDAKKAAKAAHSIEVRRENPTMKRKPTAAQIAARERFAEMARSGAFKRRVKRNPVIGIKSKKKSLTRRSQSTGRAPSSRLIMRRRKTLRAPKGFFANPNSRLYRVLERRPSASSWSPVGSFPSRQRAMQYARAYHKAASSPVAVKVTTG